jgi:hypothetical protein
MGRRVRGPGSHERNLYVGIVVVWAGSTSPLLSRIQRLRSVEVSGDIAASLLRMAAESNMRGCVDKGWWLGGRRTMVA